MRTRTPTATTYSTLRWRKPVMFCTRSLREGNRYSSYGLSETLPGIVDRVYKHFKHLRYRADSDSYNKAIVHTAEEALSLPHPDRILLRCCVESLNAGEFLILTTILSSSKRGQRWLTHIATAVINQKTIEL